MLIGVIFVVKVNWKRKTCSRHVKVMLFFIVRNCSFLGASSFSARGVYNFIPRKANIPLKLVSFFNDVLFLFCCFLKSGVTNELKILFLLKSKKVRVIYSKQEIQNCS